MLEKDATELGVLKRIADLRDAWVARLVSLAERLRRTRMGRLAEVAFGAIVAFEPALVYLLYAFVPATALPHFAKVVSPVAFLFLMLGGWLLYIFHAATFAPENRRVLWAVLIGIAPPLVIPFYFFWHVLRTPEFEIEVDNLQG